MGAAIWALPFENQRLGDERLDAKPLIIYTYTKITHALGLCITLNSRAIELRDIIRQLTQKTMVYFVT